MEDSGADRQKRQRDEAELGLASRWQWRRACRDDDLTRGELQGSSSYSCCAEGDGDAVQGVAWRSRPTTASAIASRPPVRGRAQPTHGHRAGGEAKTDPRPASNALAGRSWRCRSGRAVPASSSEACRDGRWWRRLPAWCWCRRTTPGPSRAPSGRRRRGRSGGRRSRRTRSPRPTPRRRDRRETDGRGAEAALQRPP